MAQKPETMWCMTFPAKNARGFMLTTCMSDTRKGCWDDYSGHSYIMREHYEKAGYKPVKVKVEVA